MCGTVKILVSKEGNTTVATDLQGQDLYRALVAFTAHIATKLNTSEDVIAILETAAKDALKQENVPLNTNEGCDSL